MLQREHAQAVTISPSLAPAAVHMQREHAQAVTVGSVIVKLTIWMASSMMGLLPISTSLASGGVAYRIRSCTFGSCHPPRFHPSEDAPAVRSFTMAISLLRPLFGASRIRFVPVL